MELSEGCACMRTRVLFCTCALFSFQPSSAVAARFFAFPPVSCMRCWPHSCLQLAGMTFCLKTPAPCACHGLHALALLPGCMVCGGHCCSPAALRPRSVRLLLWAAAAHCWCAKSCESLLAGMLADPPSPASPRSKGWQGGSEHDQDSI